MKKQENSKLTYILIGIGGFIFTALSFVLQCEESNIKDEVSSILSGLGTGAISSLIVSVLINITIDKRLKSEQNTAKMIVLSDLQYAAKITYCRIIYDINEFLAFSEKKVKYVYNVYNDRKDLLELFDVLNSVNYNDLSEKEKNRYNKLFGCLGYMVDKFSAELKCISKQDYFIKGLLSEDEMKSIYSNHQFDQYIKCVAQKNEYWSNKQIIDYKKCLKLLKFTILLSSKIIATFDECKEKVESEEKLIKQEIDAIYFHEVYCNSEEYIQYLIEREEAEAEYYNEHPELLEELEEQYKELVDKTPTDQIIDDIDCLLNGFSLYSFEDLLGKIDKDDIKLIEYFQQEEIKKIIKKKEYKKVIAKIYGKDYLKKLFN